ncbi:MAG: serine/threonine protein kinase [Eubacterium sp.]|nr:serine/threonine protein kinase [Eubacterium sp.]
MYQFLKEHIENQFTHYRTIRETDNHSAIVVQHKSTGKLFVQHTFSGSAACCERLLGVRSPYLPEIFEAAEADGQVMVLEEYVQGDSMHEMLAGACFSPEETKQIALDLCRALYVLHSMNIIHRDVKPENVILRENRAVLLDFNAARIFRPEQLTDTIALGTVGYAPPEQFGFSGTDVRSDIYSLGVTMNIMLTGTHPSVRLAGGRLGRIITKCTMTQPGRRYQDVTRLMEVLML